MVNVVYAIYSQVSLLGADALHAMPCMEIVTKEVVMNTLLSPAARTRFLFRESYRLSFVTFVLF
jgi:hypothetical protein